MNSFVFPTKVNMAIESSLTQLKKHSLLQSFYGTEIVKKSILKCRNPNFDKVEFHFRIKLKK